MSLNQISVIVFAAVTFTATHLVEDESAKKAQIAEALRLTSSAATEYKLNVVNSDTNVSTPCKLEPKPILQWSNPVAGDIYGNVFLWTHEKRPVAVGSFYKWFSPWTHGTHEFQSLSSHSLDADYKGMDVWQPKTSGLQWKSLADAKPAGQSTTIRLLQMRKIAKQFSVEKTEDGSDRGMRLLSQPVYRYSCPEDGVIDGAIFVFVQGTDPEVWVLVEAVTKSKPSPGKPSPKDTTQWNYALARMNRTQFKVKLKDKVVQDFPQLDSPDLKTPDNVYYKIATKELPE